MSEPPTEVDGLIVYPPPDYRLLTFLAFAGLFWLIVPPAKRRRRR